MRREIGGFFDTYDLHLVSGIVSTWILTDSRTVGEDPFEFPPFSDRQVSLTFGYPTLIRGDPRR